jgi:hypothetical protein
MSGQGFGASRAQGLGFTKLFYNFRGSEAGSNGCIVSHPHASNLPWLNYDELKNEVTPIEAG